MQADVSKDKQAMASTNTTKARGPKTIQGKVRTMADPAQQKTMQEYESALKTMQEGKYDKAGDIFRKLIPQASPEIAERARVYLEACGRQAAKQERKFGGPEEQYDYAISLLNTGLYDEAREQLETILAGEPQADYALYGLSILESMTGQTEQCPIIWRRRSASIPKTASTPAWTRTFRTWRTTRGSPSFFILK